MEEQEEESNVLLFDTLFTTNELQMLKVIFPHFPPKTQRLLAIHIKLQELIYTIIYFKQYTYPITPNFFNTKNETEYKTDNEADDETNTKKDTKSNNEPVHILTELLPYCSEKQKEMILQFKQIFDSMEKYREIMEMYAMLKDFLPEKNENDTAEEILSSALSPEQQEILNLLKGGLLNGTGEMDDGSGNQ